MPFAYPVAARDDTVVDQLHGRPVPDPYRALEDPDAPETAAFCEASNKVTAEYIGRAPAFRARVKADIEAMMDYGAWERERAAPVPGRRLAGPRTAY
jgi:prolyl oligopeptidase